MKREVAVGVFLFMLMANFLVSVNMLATCADESFGELGGLEQASSSSSVLWNQTYGTADIEYVSSMVQTDDGGFAVAGYTGLLYGSSETWLVKTDEDGNLEWNQTYGETTSIRGYCLIQTDDGGFAIAGRTNVPVDRDACSVLT